MAQMLYSSRATINDAIEQADKNLNNPLIDKNNINVLNYYSAMAQYMLAVESNDNKGINTAQKNMRNALNGNDSFFEDDIYFQEAKKAVGEFLGQSDDNSQNLIDTLKASGGEYEIVVNAGACDECMKHSHSGKLSDIDNIQLPPYHPNCKCKVEIYDSNDNIVYETPEKQYIQNSQAREEDYLTKSFKQVLLGNYADETTALGTAGQIALGLTGLDIAADVRDVLYDITHWKNDWGHLGQTLLDSVGLIPVIGAFKNIDEAADLVKYADELVDGVSDAAKRVDDVVDSVGDIIKHSDDVAEGVKKANPNNVKVNIGQQDKHILGTHNYKQSVAKGQKRSILTENPQQLLDEFAGIGTPMGGNKEWIDFDKVIGKYYDVNTGTYMDTTKGIIHYDSKGSAHIVPSNPTGMR